MKNTATTTCVLWMVTLGWGLCALAQESILLDSSPRNPPTQIPLKQPTPTSATPTPTPAPTPVAQTPAKSAPATKAAPVTPPSSGTTSSKRVVVVRVNVDGQELQVNSSGAVGTPQVQTLSNPNRFVMDIPNAGLARHVPRNFTTTLGQVRLGIHDTMVRVVVDFGSEKVPTYQMNDTGGQLVVSFAGGAIAATKSEAPLPVKRPVTNIPDMNARDSQLISIELKDVDIRNVLKFIGDASGLNIVPSEGVRGKVSVKLNGVPWYEALNSVVGMRNLTYTQTGDVIKVMTREELERTRVSNRSNGPYQNNDGEVVTRLIAVNYASAKDLAAQVKDILSPRGRVTSDDRTNMVIVSDIGASLDRVSALIKSLDTQTPQIMIEARMVEAELNFSRSLGIEWGGALTRPVGAAGLSPKYAINLPAANPTTALGIQLGTLTNWGVINARLTAAEQNGRVKTVAMPKIMALDNKAARITQGYQIPVTFANANIVNTQFVYAALQLDVTPHVSSDGAIMMSIKMNNNEPDFGHVNAQGVPAIITKEANTDLLVKDGDTAVIGGIYTRAQNNTVKQTPLLGSIPILGLLFKSTQVEDNQREMMVFLTPRLVNRQNPPKLDSQIEEKSEGFHL